ncbi:Crp/Fnr family transcriptional regulator [Aquimarina litoralis]|uniref:Crp/Fnr family transcriptional regulator n=1 Tax=Aquimarina litoralis TaxID=584605 RepID=A0ABP3U4V8_9FLAO
MSLTSLNALIPKDQKQSNHYCKKEIIVQGTCFYKKIFHVKNGIVKISSITKNGEETIPLLLTSGQYFGAKPMIDSFPFHYVCEAQKNNTEIQEFDIMILQNLLHDKISENIGFLKILGDQYIELEKRIKMLYLRNTEQRILHVLMEFKDKFDHKLDHQENIIINMPLNQEEMSNYLRVTRVTINKIMNKLKRKLLIKSDQNTLTLTKKFFEYYGTF